MNKTMRKILILAGFGIISLSLFSCEKKEDKECSDTSISEDIGVRENDVDVVQVKKPVIYLYPKEETKVSVSLDYKGDFSCIYPAFDHDNTWVVTATPEGEIKDNNGQLYNYLYWEGVSKEEYDFSKGYCIKGKDTEKFLEKELSKLGLNRKEANEFIVYWLPLMKDNKYNVISFQKEAYTDSAKLISSPKADTLIRVFMAWYASDEFVNINEPDDDKTPIRQGFTIVEWGGSKVK
ncbi:hypothetical protein SAMN05216249_104144 [Acetitomaculum ruminis DSM 5522]|uniref:Lipoprotein n=1 Tax=Acetitomaculum ruminis DSM 5522 TaxID=1120918 RepID=A0A1I0WND5_9FIRM|nr:hypothetical protein [Acetitomaculum ruminis]SFA89476.1 hypothetical protein SAMN05216249_104144 [Acetitomaculum ruminis DSM 5522]